ncbi:MULTISPECIES: hypothetical protein [Methylotuvimicrobium]|uniref:Uncharacterized protein n=2 Tax=Methylotuvimicrobium TaxID=2822410 RepID=G4T2N3_META2|nr:MULTISPECIES: hypothetical protein [Methylotuvimicrobium]QCW83742.1 hypothetical protein EQU24_16940 [Methylotuvimicrobium buryatense]CCE22517.1 conserved protein of unknown function [Methylotuvimicrobium alcaliphilum 20Z]
MLVLNGIPSTYQEWRHCITVDCNIALTEPFVGERIAILSNAGCEETRRFEQLYGIEHRKAVLGWFRQAQQESTKKMLHS